VPSIYGIAAAFRRFTRFGLAALAGLTTLCAAGAKDSPRPAESGPIVKITAGELRGISKPSGAAEFLGIPYAQPPVGDLRWHEPLPAKEWSGVRDAKAFGAPCAQVVLGDWNKQDAESSREDCLYLNVMTPQWPPKEPLPVMLWIHGGGNNGGTASSALYKDGTLCEHGIVLVTVNYRLGIFGFFSHADLTRESPHHSSGNYGLLDQIAALRWVHDNIAKFGGDPKNVTLFGQSAGAMDLGMLMTSPLAKGLFQRAIAQSGAAPSGLPKLEELEKASEKWLQSLKLPEGQSGINYLRGLSTAEIFKAVGDPNASPESQATITPVVDGWVLQREPAAVFAAGQEARIPMIIGTTTREFSLTLSTEKLRTVIQKDYGKVAPKALLAYGIAGNSEGTDDPLFGPPSAQWSADTEFRCPATTQAIWHNAVHQPVHEYQLERAIPGHESEGAVHSGDLVYVFGYYPKTGNIGGVFGDSDHKLADLMEHYWTNFAKTGNPNAKGLPEWPEFDSSQAYIEFTQDVQVVTKTGLRQNQCDVYRENLKELMGH
jgi:para-nitrobenzyl esterase